MTTATETRTGRQRLRRLGAPAALLIAASGALSIPVLRAAASADGCVYFENDPSSCVRVTGSGTHVDSVAGGVKLSPRQSTVGHNEVYGPGFHFDSADTTWSNPTDNLNHRVFGPNFAVGHDVLDGSTICATFWEKTGTGYARHSPACVSIHP